MSGGCPTISHPVLRPQAAGDGLTNVALVIADTPEGHDSNHDYGAYNVACRKMPDEGSIIGAAIKVLAAKVRSDRAEIAALTARIDALTKERDELKAHLNDALRDYCQRGEWLSSESKVRKEAEARCARLETVLRDAKGVIERCRKYVPGNAGNAQYAKEDPRFRTLTYVAHALEAIAAALGTNDATPKPNEGQQ